MMANDVTAYARSIGYQGKRPVQVQDGVVISHGNQDWGVFCERLREQGASLPSSAVVAA